MQPKLGKTSPHSISEHLRILHPKETSWQPKLLPHAEQTLESKGSATVPTEAFLGKTCQKGSRHFSLRLLQQVLVQVLRYALGVVLLSATELLFFLQVFSLAVSCMKWKKRWA